MEASAGPATERSGAKARTAKAQMADAKNRLACRPAQTRDIIQRLPIPAMVQADLRGESVKISSRWLGILKATRTAAAPRETVARLLVAPAAPNQ